MANILTVRLCCALLLAFTAAGCTSTSPKISTTYYTISGLSGADLDREISEKGPMKGHALASTAVRFVPVVIEYEQTESSCRFHKAAFRVEADMTLPRWREHLLSPDKELRIAWKFLSAYARAHEEVHIAIAEKYARKVGEDLMALSPRRDCDRLEAAAGRVLDKVRAAHDREQRAFDAAEQKRLAELLGD